MSQRTGHDAGLDLPRGGGHRRHGRPAEPRRRRRSLLALLVSLLLLGALVGSVVVAGRTLLSGLDLGGSSGGDYAGPGSGQVVVKVAEGATAADIGRTLEDQGVVKSAAAFTKAATADNRSRTLQPGFYRLKREMKAADALALLLAPASRLRGKLAVPEGFTAAQIVDRVAKQLGVDRTAVQQAAKNPAAIGVPAYAQGRIEGFLFPATYELEPGTTPQQALQVMVDRFVKAADDVRLEERAKARNITPYQAVIVASLIERESRVPSEYPKVSRVIYNRLQQNIRLGIDATILYGLGRTGGGLKESELQKDGPYNTRTRAGLPPTPIASPGQAALEAALAPAAGDWLYYVLADKQGNHLFTADYDEFLRQKAKSQREGIF